MKQHLLTARVSCSVLLIIVKMPRFRLDISTTLLKLASSGQGSTKRP